jgi:hypothetical protein
MFINPKSYVNNDAEVEGLERIDEEGVEGIDNSDEALHVITTSTITAESVSVPNKANEETNLAEWEYNAETMKKLPVSNFFPQELLPTNAVALKHENIVKTVFSNIEPTVAEKKHCESIIDTLRVQTKLSLASNVFDLSFRQLDCALRTDTLRLSVVVSENFFNVWNDKLVDQLNLFVIAPEQFLEDMFDENNSSGFIRHVKNHKVSAVRGNNKIITFEMDGLNVEIFVNNRADLCMIAFLEEINTLVGKNNLFKKSILFIKGWWLVENERLFSKEIKPQFISDIALSIMVCSVFNQYHRFINYPLQALSFFLCEYSGYDGDKQAITLQGIVMFDQHNQPCLNSVVKEDDLIGFDLLSRYWFFFFFNINF